MAAGTMVFVDGENFTIRGQVIAKAANITLVEGPCYRRDTFLWVPHFSVPVLLDWVARDDLVAHPIRRSFYYTAVQGDHDLVTTVHEQLWQLKFTPRVFKKSGTRPSKRVDISLATEALSNAHLGNHESAVLIAGDEDYVPLVEEIKRMGKIVTVLFFEGHDSGMSKELRLAADAFYPLNDTLLHF